MVQKGHRQCGVWECPRNRTILMRKWNHQLQLVQSRLYCSQRRTSSWMPSWVALVVIGWCGKELCIWKDNKSGLNWGPVTSAQRVESFTGCCEQHSWDVGGHLRYAGHLQLACLSGKGVKGLGHGLNGLLMCQGVTSHPPPCPEPKHQRTDTPFHCRVHCLLTDSLT